ncbi:MAG: hypothetical protein D6713_00070 [Deltaproteobacteria bacterium]|nr:MAG: hypothetical protein D6713_00070 [Deltaproteobacteria bacterium]
MILYCPGCGAQNFIGKERLRVAREKPPLCWVCGETLPVGETSPGEGESKECTKDGTKSEE